MKNLYVALLALIFSTGASAQGITSLTGSFSMCTNSFMTLADTMSGGSFYSLAPAVASIDSATGVVYGIAAGTATISYDVPGVGSDIVTITVNPTPNQYAVTGSGSYCSGSGTPTVGLTGSDPGVNYTLLIGSGALVSTMAGTGTPLSFGISTGGTYTILATDTSTGCLMFMADSAGVIINPTPTAILGAGPLCSGATIGLSDTTAGGTWTSASPGIASIDASGVVTGVSAGTATIIYIIPATSCFVSATVLVNPLPIISGTVLICGGSSGTLSASPGGGAWSSSNAAVGTVSAAGVVAAIAAGMDTVTYTLPTGCTSMVPVTVNIQPTISGTSTVCVGSANTLFASPSSGTWTSSIPSTAGVGASTGLVTGFTAGSATITYTLPSGCYNTSPETVITTPPPISGASVACVFATATLTDAASGGVWTSTNPSAASIGSSSGVVTGITTGSTVITYSFGGGCYTTTSLAVYNLPAPITGGGVLCLGHTLALNDTSSGGTWSSGGTNATVAGSTGVVFGIGAGTETITYTAPTGCYTTTIVTVNTLPCSPTAIASVNDQPISISPNPAFDEVTIRMGSGTFTSFTITNSLGQIVMAKPMTSTTTTISVSGLPPAIYYMTFRGEQGFIVTRLVKQ